MELKIEKQEEFHNNGKLAYVQTIAILTKEQEGSFRNTIKHPDGYCWMRVGKQAKYFDNGVNAWTLNYDEKGEVIKENNTSHRKDGTNIVYSNKIVTFR